MRGAAILSQVSDSPTVDKNFKKSKTLTEPRKKPPSKINNNLTMMHRPGTLQVKELENH